MRIESQAGAPIDSPTQVDVERLLRELRPPDGLVILEARPGDFMQTAADGDGGFVLEYRDGPAAVHYRARNKPSLAEVIGAFQSYLRRDGAWRTSFEWQHFTDDRQAPRSTPERRASGLGRSLARAAVTMVWGLVQLGILAALLFLAGVAGAFVGFVLIPHFAGGSATWAPLPLGFGAGVIAACIVNHSARMWLQRARLRLLGSDAVRVIALVVWVDRSTTFNPRAPSRTTYAVHLRWQDPLSHMTQEQVRRYAFWGNRSKPFDNVFRQRAMLAVRYAPGRPSRFIIDVPFAPMMADLVVGAD